MQLNPAFKRGHGAPVHPTPCSAAWLADANFWATVINVVDTSATYLSETTSSTGRARKHEKAWVENCQNPRGCFSTDVCSVHSLSTDFSCFYHGFTLIRTYVIIFLLDLCITECFMKFSLISRGCFWQRGGARAPPKPLILHPCEKEAAAGIGHSCSSNFANVPGLLFLSPETGCQIRRPSVSTTRSLFHHRSDSQVPAMYLFSPRLAHPVQDESCLKKGTK